ncbi:hypothetical protein F2P81_007759 [Scophthalmus maximus]|uniref:Uncharacterized protein n=1 Tax=Scophthalmus maximus TaxID=52904 RepID=A0A6A4T8N2_SCOMX|nr:hypothetical protein F2P81_007759 [Scophthalmus maximus]
MRNSSLNYKFDCTQDLSTSTSPPQQTSNAAAEDDRSEPTRRVEILALLDVNQCSLKMLGEPGQKMDEERD